MLHAELHGKLSETATNAERLEDTLTSAVFDTLLIAGAVDVLCAWFARAIGAADAFPRLDRVSKDLGYWFWPRLGDTEPDLVLLIGGVIVIVEAKFRSRKSGATAGEGEAADDQLARQWRVCSAEANRAAIGTRTLHGLRAVLARHETPRVLIYLVRRASQATSYAELEESATAAPGARMFLLTWEDLDAVLAARAHPTFWERDLRELLARRGLTAFRDFAHLTLVARQGLLQAWAAKRGPTRPGFARLTLASPQGVLQAWAAQRQPTRPRFNNLLSAPTVQIRHLATRSSQFPEHTP